MLADLPELAFGLPSSPPIVAVGLILTYFFRFELPNFGSYFNELRLATLLSTPTVLVLSKLSYLISSLLASFFLFYDRFERPK